MSSSDLTLKQRLRTSYKKQLVAQNNKKISSSFIDKLTNYIIHHYPLSIVSTESAVSTESENNNEVIVAIYIPTIWELNIRKIADRLLGLGYKMAVPIIEESHMQFVYYDPKQPLVLYTHPTSLFKLMIPQVCKPCMPTVIFCPALCINNKGYRLGYGGGYYDRYRAKYPYIPVLAVVQDFQFIQDSFEDSWDYPVDGIITEQMQIFFPN